ncbi:phosphatase PAP2 family protein [Actinocorallia longicatena]|uniref:Phosphatase PAP2 family protein n=1 Tax=Actinocorallia longicatena TaxID=111803 RepID=A0ABP6PW15_9ACTN
MKSEAGRPGLLRELLLIAILYSGYRFGRLSANGHVERAHRNAGDVTRLERFLHLPTESSVQNLLLHSEPLTKAANAFYAGVHFPATIAFLIFMFWRHPVHYVWIRRVLTVLTLGGLIGHVLVPLAPPRMLGLLDTGRVFGPTVYGDPDPHSLANQYAAMPSLHIGWALVVAIGMIAVLNSRWKWLWLAYPTTTLLVVVATANHYWLDGMVVTVLLVLSLALVPAPGRPWSMPALRDREQFAPTLAAGRGR